MENIRSGKRNIRLAPYFTIICNCLGCTHSLAITSSPPDAEVFMQTSENQERKLLGKTPLSTDIPAAHSASLTIEKPGYQSLGIATNFEMNGNSAFTVTLLPLDENWLKSLPKEVSAKIQNDALKDLLDLQSKIYVSTPEQIKTIALEIEPKYGHLSAYHLLLGNYSFYRSDFQTAQKRYQTALNLQPQNDLAKRMLVLTEMKMIEGAKILNAKAIDEIGTAAKRIASLGNGFIAESKSEPTLAKPDGYRITLPSDSLFAPVTAKIIPSGRTILDQLSGFLQKIAAPMNVKIEAHTDSDPLRELQLGTSGTQTKINKMNQTSWELSSARAAALMLYLRTAGVKASSWSIAGFADSEPLVPVTRDSFDEQFLNRRVVFDISLSATEQKPGLNEAEIEGLKKSLQLFLFNAEQNKQNSPVTGAGNEGANSKNTSERNSPELQKRNKEQTTSASNNVKASGEGAEDYDPDSAAKRLILNRRLQKAKPSFNQNLLSQPESQRNNSKAIPVPKVPKGK